MRPFLLFEDKTLTLALLRHDKSWSNCFSGRYYIVVGPSTVVLWLPLRCAKWVGIPQIAADSLDVFSRVEEDCPATLSAAIVPADVVMLCLQLIIETCLTRWVDPTTRREVLKHSGVWICGSTRSSQHHCRRFSDASTETHYRTRNDTAILLDCYVGD